MADRYDAVVVGAGATGGWAAKELTGAGLRVALLEAGPEVPFAARDEVSVPGDRSRQQVQARCYAYTERTAGLFVDDVDNPYTHPEDKPFDWIRGRVVGGRLHTWGAMCLRMSDHELKAASRDGHGDDWPLSYADLAPAYDRVEAFMRVCGEAAGLPQVPDGNFTAPPPLSAGELAFKRAVEGRWDTRRVTGARIATAPADAMLAAAKATGRLTLMPDSIAARVLTDGPERVDGVAYVDRMSGERRELRADHVVLCASTIESTRLLFNSAGDDHPDGLANSSGVLGHYLFDHTYGIGLDGSFAAPPRPPAEKTTYGCIVPSYRNFTEDEVDFLRGYGIEMQVHTPIAGPAGRLLARGRKRSGFFWMRVFGEVLPRFENRVTVDPEQTDAWDIPVARVDCVYSDNERKMVADQVATMRELAEVAGLQVEAAYDELGAPGLSIHEMGTARMGDDPKTSVLNRDCRAWDVENLYVTDGAAFTSGGCQNPTLTMMALTVRACDALVADARGRAS